MTTDVERLLDLIDRHRAAKAHAHDCWEAELFAAERSRQAAEAEGDLRNKIKDLVLVEWGEENA